MGVTHIKSGREKVAVKQTFAKRPDASMDKLSPGANLPGLITWLHQQIAN